MFVSIGDEEKLSKFLELNPHIPRDQAFVDGYDFAAYDQVGFDKKFDEVDAEDAKEAAKNLGAPSMPGGAAGWFNYMKSFVALSPIPPDMKFGSGVPEGVKRIGGTFVVQGDEVEYQWSDRVPGDHPDIDEIVKIATAGVTA